MKCICSFFLPSCGHKNGDESFALPPEFSWIYWSMQMSVHMTWCCMRDFPPLADQDCIADGTLGPYDYECARYQWSSLCLATGTLGLLGVVMASLPPEDCLMLSYDSTTFFLSSLVKLPNAAIIHTSTSKKTCAGPSDLYSIQMCHNNYCKKLCLLDHGYYSVHALTGIEVAMHLCVHLHAQWKNGHESNAGEFSFLLYPYYRWVSLSALLHHPVVLTALD